MSNNGHTNKIFHLRFQAEILDRMASLTETDRVRIDAKAKAARMRGIASRYERPLPIAAE